MGLASGTAGGAEVHDCLGIVGDPQLRRMLLCEMPELISDSALPRPALYRVVTRQHPLDVAILYGRAAIHGERHNRAGGRATDARQCLEAIEFRGKYALVLIAHYLSATV